MSDLLWRGCRRSHANGRSEHLHALLSGLLDERHVRLERLGLDVGGVDFLSTNIAESYKSIGGGICECNAAPGFRMHVAPSEGKSRDVAGPVIDMLFPAGTPVRIPIASITGTNGKTTTVKMLASILSAAGLRAVAAGPEPAPGRPPVVVAAGSWWPRRGHGRTPRSHAARAGPWPGSARPPRRDGRWARRARSRCSGCDG